MDVVRITPIVVTRSESDDRMMSELTETQESKHRLMADKVKKVTSCFILRCTVLRSQCF